jgi:hypothetical protein
VIRSGISARMPTKFEPSQSLNRIHHYPVEANGLPGADSQARARWGIAALLGENGLALGGVA